MEVFFIDQLESHNKKHGYNIAKGGPGGMLGRNHTRKSIEQMSLSHKKLWTAERRAEHGRIMQGKTITQAHRDAISLATRGERNPMFGKKHSEAAKTKIGESSKKRCGAKHPRARAVLGKRKQSQRYEHFPTTRAAGLRFGIDSTMVSYLCKGKHKSKHYDFKYA